MTKLGLLLPWPALLASLLLSGCLGGTNISATAINVPVLVGPVKHVGASPAAEPDEKLGKFSAKAQFTAAGSGGQHYEYSGGNVYSVTTSTSAWSSFNDVEYSMAKSCAGRGDLAVQVENIKAESFIFFPVFIAYGEDNILVDGYSFKPK